MNFLNRAIKNVTRVKSRSILLMITFFILGNLVIVGLGVSQAVTDAKVVTRKNMRAVVSYELDYDALNRYVASLETQEEKDEFYNNNYPRINREKVQEIVGMDDRIIAVNYMLNEGIYSVGFETIKTSEERTGGGSVMYEDGTVAEYKEPDLMLKGNIYPNMIELVENTYTMIEGRMYTQEEIDSYAQVVVIEQGLAELNGFKIGDRITVSFYQKSDIDYYNLEEEDVKMELEIIGIYDNSQVLDPNDPDYQWLPAHAAPENSILVPTTSYVQKRMEIDMKILTFFRTQMPDMYYDYQIVEDDYYYGSVVILLGDPLEVEDFIMDNNASIGEFYRFNAQLDSFDKVARPLDAMARFADILVGIIVFNALVIVTLITALTLKNREYEIGVLLAMGVSKVKVIGQMFIELIIVGVLGFTLAIGSGALISGVIGDWMLDAQLSTELIEEDSNNWTGWYGEETYFTEITQEELLSKYEVSIKPIMIVWIYAGGLAVIFASVLIPGLMVMRYNPKQILTNVR